MVDPETGEIKLEGGGEISEKLAEELRNEMGVKEIEVIDEVKDWLILNTLKEDATRTHEEALLKIYLRLRPGTPPQLEKAKQLFDLNKDNLKLPDDKNLVNWVIPADARLTVPKTEWVTWLPFAVLAAILLWVGWKRVKS